MGPLRKSISSRERAAALIIVLAFVVLLTGLAIAYFSRTTSDRPVAHSSFNQSEVDQLAASAMENIIGDLRQEIVNGWDQRLPGEAYLYGLWAGLEYAVRDRQRDIKRGPIQSAV